MAKEESKLKNLVRGQIKDKIGQKKEKSIGLIWSNSNSDIQSQRDLSKGSVKSWEVWLDEPLEKSEFFKMGPGKLTPKVASKAKVFKF